MKSILKIALSFLILAFVGCKGDGSLGDVEIVKFSNHINKNDEAHTICVLDESVEPLAPVSDFSMINDTTFVVVDKRLASIFYTNGERKGSVISRGRGKGEVLSPSSVCVSSDYIYIWCGTLMKVVSFTHDGKFHMEFSGFDRSVKKMTVDDDKHLYMYTSGDLNKAGDVFNGVVRVFDLTQRKITASFGARTDEDEVMFITANSGGIDYCNGNLLYVHPGNPRIYLRNMHDNGETVYQIEDAGFNMQKVEHPKDITGNIHEWVAFSQENAVIRGIYCSEGKVYMVAETGSYDMESRSVGTRKIRVYELDSHCTPLRTIGYDRFYVVSGFDVRNNMLLLLHTITEKTSDGDTIQNTYLSALPLT